MQTKDAQMRRNGVLNSNASKYASIVDYSYDTLKEDFYGLSIPKNSFNRNRKIKGCSFPIFGPEKCTYRGIESDKYTTLSAINTFLLLNMQ